MKDIIQNRFILNPNSYIIDLHNVDFITFKENKANEGTCWAKLHIGSKAVKYVCDDESILKTIIQCWAKLNGKDINIQVNEQLEEWC